MMTWFLYLSVLTLLLYLSNNLCANFDPQWCPGDTTMIEQCVQDCGAIMSLHIQESCFQHIYICMCAC